MSESQEDIPREDMICRNCRFHKPGDKEIASMDKFEFFGECRKYPPLQIVRWVKVSEIDWCGEFKLHPDYYSGI